MKNIRTWWQNMTGSARLRVQIVLILFSLAVLLSVAGAIIENDWAGLLLNLGTELGGATITFVLLDQLLASRERSEAIQEEQTRLRLELIGKMSSDVREVAVAAADELRRQNWLLDGSLANIILRRANLEGANLANADLRGVNFHRATLNGADLWHANLADSDLSGSWLHNARLWDVNFENANLWQARMHGTDMRRANFESAEMNEARMNESDLREANLKHANLQDAKLQSASLRSADLTEADLTNAQLQGADLRSAILRRVKIDGTVFDEHTTLPDGKRWSPTLDLSVYLDDE